MTRPERIVLIGPMAAGKSTIGMRLAKRLGALLIDTDHEFEKRNGPISAAFAAQGEHAFREAEARIVASSLVHDNAVISLGGGAVLDAGTQQLLQDEFVVYLATDADTVRPFITRDRRRPLLAENPVEAWQKVYDRRRSTYERLGTVQIDVSLASGRNPERVVDRIIAEAEARTDARGLADVAAPSERESSSSPACRSTDDNRPTGTREPQKDSE